MVKGLFLRSAARSAIVGAAMIAAGALVVPAQAQEDVDRSEMREQRMERRAERQEAQQQHAPQQAAQEQQAPQQPHQEFRQQRQERQAQAAPERQAQRESRQEWRQQRQAQHAEPHQQVQRGDADDGRDLQGYTEGTQRDRAWARRQAADGSAPIESARTENAPDRQIQHRDWRGRDGSHATDRGERNRSYVDRDRSGSYRDGHRGSGHDWRSSHDNRDHSGNYRNGYNNSWRDGHSADGYRDRHHRDAYRSGYRNGHRDDWRSGNHRRWNNDWRRDNRYNWSGYRNQHRNVFSVGRYYSPYRNYSYSRLSIGLFLDRGFYGNNYWVNDPWQYRLPAVYGPYKWVRYYDDVVLVDIYTGEVVDVIHNFFW